ncbi:HD domain-containing protein [bacterium]|nr:HD domain-containing protein [bacterium]
MPFQRLRHLHQLATTFLIFPSATHKRFEHCIGVMELATRIYRVLRANLPDKLRTAWKLDDSALDYWEKVLRVAALCHDLGHLPFSHGIEGLLPAGRDHEDLSRQVIESGPIPAILESCRPEIKVHDVIKLALEKEKVAKEKPSAWEEILNQVITGECFGADRMDYLLRDSYHLGVSHGHFDHHRLIECLRVLPLPPTPGGERGGYGLGIVQGGIQSAEALLLARYMMFSQVYYHKTRVIFDYHLQQFIQQWLEGQGNKSPESLLRLTDNDVFVALEAARSDDRDPGHSSARRLVDRQHFRLIYQRNPADDDLNPEAFEAVYAGLRERYGELVVERRKKAKTPEELQEKAKDVDFPVFQSGISDSVSSLALSQVLKTLPQASYDYVYASPEIRQEACQWLDENKSMLLSRKDTPAEEK